MRITDTHQGSAVKSKGTKNNHNYIIIIIITMGITMKEDQVQEAASSCDAAASIQLHGIFTIKEENLNEMTAFLSVDIADI